VKVVLVSMVYPHPRAGYWPGIERQVGDFAAALAQAGATVTVVTSFRNGGEASEEHRGVRIVRVHDLSERLGRAGALLSWHVSGFGRAVSKLDALLRGADVVESFVPLPETPALSRPGLRRFSFFAHRDRPARWQDYLHMPAYFRMERRYFRRVEGIIVASAESRQVLVEEYGVAPERIHTIPLGVAPAFLAPAPADRRRAAGAPARLLYVGPLIRRKDLPTLIRALPRIAQAGTPCELIVAGDGPEREPLERLAASEGVAGLLTFKGFVPESRLPELYRDADLFVFPSLKEGFGQVLLEAMASGLPVVCSERAPMTEVLGDAGVYFTPGNPASLAGRVTQVLSHPEQRARLAEAGRRRVRERFTWPAVAAATLALYGREAA
jgi:glycosyltransferase involved in cell wall biosynthesis